MNMGVCTPVSVRAKGVECKWPFSAKVHAWRVRVVGDKVLSRSPSLCEVAVLVAKKVSLCPAITQGSASCTTRVAAWLTNVVSNVFIPEERAALTYSTPNTVDLMARGGLVQVSV